MTRVKMGIAILLLLLLTSIGTEWYVYRQTQTLLSELSQVEQAAQMEDISEAQVPFNTFAAHWEQAQQVLRFMVWRDRMQQVDVAVARLDPMRVADCDELLAQIAETRLWLERLGTGEIPLLHNVL